jgi:single-strand DNA-binding protein
MTDTITITGNVAMEPEQRRSGDTLIASFRVASPQRRLDRASQKWVDGETNWYKVSAFRGLAQHILDSVHKGEPVIITGRLRIRSWESGDKRGTDVEIDADAVGHDLRWGTTRYTKTPRQRSAEQVDSWDTATPPADEWSAPGVPAQNAGAETDATQPGTSERPALELAGAEKPF